MEQRLRRALFDRLEMLGEEASNAEPGNLARLARTEIRRLTDGWRELLASHQPDEDGRCPQCSGWLRRRRWPCPVWLSAHHNLIGEGVWHKQRPKPSPGTSRRRNPTIIIPRQLPAPVAPLALTAGHALTAAPIHRAAVVEHSQRPRARAAS